MGRTLLLMAAAALLVASPAWAQEKGGEDETGAYEVVANWPQPWSPARTQKYSPAKTGDRARLLTQGK